MKTQTKVATIHLYHEHHDDGREWTRLRIQYSTGRVVSAAAEGYVSPESLFADSERVLRTLAARTPLF